MKCILERLASSFALAAIIATPLTVTLTLTPTEVAAQKGGNGNGNGNGNGANRNRDSRDQDDRNNGNRQNREVSETEERTNNGRGAIARELKGLNAAHASANALANASPDSMPGKLRTYRDAVVAERDYAGQLTASESTYNALLGMTEEEFLELNPDLHYGETLAAAEANYKALAQAASVADRTSTDALTALNGGTELSEAAMQELWRLLGL